LEKLIVKLQELELTYPNCTLKDIDIESQTKLHLSLQGTFIDEDMEETTNIYVDLDFNNVNSILTTAEVHKFRRSQIKSVGEEDEDSPPVRDTSDDSPKENKTNVEEDKTIHNPQSGEGPATEGAL
jgi:hypothetical protein